MFDIEIHMDNEPGQLALIGKTFGGAGINVEGGGMWVVNGTGVAHFLVDDGAAAEAALVSAGMRVIAVRPVILQRLRQKTPGQLGSFSQAMADAGVNIEVLYSNHDKQLVVVVDDPVAAAEVSDAWMAGFSS